MIANKKSYFYLRLFLDLLILNGTFILAAVLAQSFPILLSRNYMFALMALLNFIWYFSSNVLNFYDDFNTRYFSFQFASVVKNIIAQAVVSVFFIFLVKEDLFTRNFMVLNSIFLLLFISFRIQLLRNIQKAIAAKGRNAKNLLIVGAGELGQNFYKLINTHRDFGLNFTGYIDNVQETGRRNEILGGVKDLETVITTYNIEVVVIAIPLYESSLLKEIIRICNRHAVRTHIIPDYIQFVSKKFKFNMLGDLPIITIRDEPLAEAHWRLAKRIFDIFFSFIAALLVLSWLIPLIYILNMIYSPGKLFFVQDRIGAGNKLFKCFKFRTMHSAQPQTFRPAIEGDPRVTKIGKFLRKSNLDELPQLINVLKGDMSIVGPRPHPVAFNEVYSQIVDEIRLRSLVKPGISGWAQVHGFRGDVPDEEEQRARTLKRIEYDIWYIENWTFWLDIQIILMTVWQMLTGNTRGI